MSKQRFSFLNKRCVCGGFRGHSENNRTQISLLHSTMECVRFFIGASIYIGNFDGGHNDRFSCIANVAESGAGLSNRANLTFN